MSQATLSPWQRSFILNTQRFIYWLSKHWLALTNLFIFTYVGLPFAAPVLMKAGWTQPAQAIYTIYKPMCHQLTFRSWFLFGEQPVYPRDDYAARFGLENAEWQELFLHARDFVGNEQMGYKVAFCQRDIATFAAILLGGLVYSVLRHRKLPPMPLWAFVLLGIIPIGLDGGTQFISLVIPGFPARESVWQLRTLTGALFGLSTAWLSYPYIQQGMDDTREILGQRYGWDEYAGATPLPDADIHTQVVHIIEGMEKGDRS
jgi:uncharacterized membrane protein